MARVRINNVVKHSTPADASVIFLEAIKIVNAAAPKTRDPPLSSYSQIGILKLLGCPELAWVELWQIHNLQEIYNALLFYESRLDATHADFEPRLARKVWKPVDVVLNMIHHLPYPLEVASWDTEDEQEWKMWKPEWHLLFAVKSVIDLCKDDFPVMEGESYTKEKVRAALALLMKIHSITKGVHMKEIYRDCARVAPKTPQLIIPKSLQVVTVRSVQDWCNAWMGGRHENQNSWGVPVAVYGSISSPSRGLISDRDSLSGTEETPDGSWSWVKGMKYDVPYHQNQSQEEEASYQDVDMADPGF